MLDTLFSTVIGDTLSLPVMLASIGTALLLGFFISFVYLRTHPAEGMTSSMSITLIMLPAIIAIIIMLVGNNVARAFSLAGAFSLIRFRSAPGDPKDIAYVFFTLGAGLAAGMGYLGYAVLFVVILCTVMYVLYRTQYAVPKQESMLLKITIPEDLNFQHLFDDLLDKYADAWTLKRVKTSDFGSLFEIAFNVSLKASTNHKEFMDELRCRNGNLNILLTQKEYEERY